MGGKGSGGNIGNPNGSPILADKNLDTPAKKNNFRFSMAVFELSIKPFNIKDYDQLSQRIIDYFQLCDDFEVKPAVNGLAMALDINRNTLYLAANGNQNPNGRGKVLGVDDASVCLIEKAYQLMTVNWESNMLDSHSGLNTVAGIFLGKNHFGYKDVQDVQVGSSDPLRDREQDAATIAAKYTEGLPEPSDS